MTTARSPVSLRIPSVLEFASVPCNLQPHQLVGRTAQALTLGGERAHATANDYRARGAEPRTRVEGGDWCRGGDGCRTSFQVAAGMLHGRGASATAQLPMHWRRVGRLVVIEPPTKAYALHVEGATSTV